MISYIKNVSLFSQQYQHFCAGKRQFTQRMFSSGTLPVFLPISLEYFSQSGIITHAAHLPPTVVLQGEMYVFFHLRFSICTMRIMCIMIPKQ